MNSSGRKRIGVIGAAAVAFGSVVAWMTLAAADDRTTDLEREIAVTTTELETTRKRNAAMEGEIAALAAARAAPLTVDAAKKMRLARQEKAATRKAAIADAARRQQVGHLIALEMYLRPKFEALGLSVSQWDRYEALELERREQETEARGRALARQLSAADTEATIQAASAETLEQMRALVGEKVQDELEQFQAHRSDSAWKTVQDLANRLVLSDEPLSVTQIERLRQVYAERRTGDAPEGDAKPGKLRDAVESIMTPRQLPAGRMWLRFQEITEQAIAASQAER